MDDTTRQILGMLEGERPPELKIAAAQVLGELAPKDAAVVKTLVRVLDGGDPFLARPMLVALGGIRSAAAIRALVAQLERTEHADVAAHLLAEIGTPAVAELESAFDSSGPEARTRIVGILGRAEGAAARRVLESALRDAELARRAGEALQQMHVDALDKRQAQAMKTRLTKALRGEELAPQSVAAMLGLLARLDPAGSRPTLLRHTGGDNPAMVRAAALGALGQVDLTPKQATQVLQLLEDPDDAHVVEPAIDLLEQVDGWDDSALPVIRNLLAARDGAGRRHAVRRFALHAARHFADESLVAPLLKYVDAIDLREQEAALAALGANPHAFEPLLKALTSERDAERARRLSVALVPHGERIDAKTLRALVDKGTRQMSAHDPRGEVLLDCLVRAQPDAAPAAIVDKSLRLRRQRKFAEARALLAFLASGDQLDQEGRYQLGVVGLLLARAAARDDGVAPPGDATMGHFAILVRDGFDVFGRLKKEQMLEPEDLLRVGQHFSAGVGEERRFAGDVLRMLAERHEKKRVGEEALLTLRAESLV